jgi:predicted GNAT family acetyltransferase
VATEPLTAEPAVRDNPAESRYEISLGGRRVGLSSYRLRPGGLVFLHTEISPGFEGRGLGGELARAALADVRARGLKAIPLCPFVAAYIAKHPEERDLVPTDFLPR